MPAEVFGEDYDYLPKPEMLTHEEIAALAGVICSQGVKKIRLTGGEPLLRRGLPELIRMLKEIPGERDIAMTTNGTIAVAAKRLTDGRNETYLHFGRVNMVVTGSRFTHLWLAHGEVVFGP